MSWKPIDKNTVIVEGQTVSIWDRFSSLEYIASVIEVSVKTKNDPNAGLAIFSDGKERLVKCGDCIVIATTHVNKWLSYSITSGQHKPDILYVSDDCNLIWPENHWPVCLNSPALIPIHGNKSKAWIIGVWESGANHGDAYRKNIRS